MVLLLSSLGGSCFFFHPQPILFASFDANNLLLAAGWETTNAMLRYQLQPKTLFELCVDAVAESLPAEQVARIAEADITHEVFDVCVARARGVAAARMLHNRQLPPSNSGSAGSGSNLTMDSILASIEAYCVTTGLAPDSEELFEVLQIAADEGDADAARLISALENFARTNPPQPAAADDDDDGDDGDDGYDGDDYWDGGGGGGGAAEGEYVDNVPGPVVSGCLPS